MDRKQLMGIGGLATAAAQQPPNLSIVVLDNGHYGETGMQRSHSSLGTRLAEVARGFGIAQADEIHAIDEVDALAQRINARAGLAVGPRPGLPRPHRQPSTQRRRRGQHPRARSPGRRLQRRRGG